MAAVVALGCGDNKTPATDAGSDPIDAGPSADAADESPDAGSMVEPAPGTTCASAIGLVAGQSYLGSTLNHESLTRSSCSSGTSAGSDSYFSLDLGGEAVDLVARVWIDDHLDTPFDAVLSVRRDCDDEESELACSDADFGEHLELLGETGKVHILVDGTAQYGGANQGSFALEVSTRTIVGEGQNCDPSGDTSRCTSGFRCTADTCETDSAEIACSQAVDITGDLADGSAVVLGESFAFAADYLEASCAAESDNGASEALFAFTLAGPADLVATTDFPDTEFDTVLSLRSAGDPACGGTELACADDIDVDAFNFKSTLAAEDLPAGDYVLVVDGSVSHPGTGRFRLTVTTSP